MAKDGTMRGGARVGSGRKSKALTEKIDSGLAATVIDLPEPAEISGEDVPPVKDFLKAAQKSGIDLCAEDVFKATFLWLEERGCDRLVNTQLIEQYAMMVAYNKPEKNKNRVPICPKEKELAILEALKSFRMLPQDTEYFEQEA